MARRQVLTVQPRPHLKRNRPYRARVQEIHINRKAQTLDVTVEHTERGQVGRIHSFRFELPLYPESPASRFLAACGLDASQAGNDVCVDEAVGATLAMRFPAGDSDTTIVTFEPVSHAGDDSQASGHRQSTFGTGQLDKTINGKDPQ